MQIECAYMHIHKRTVMNWDDLKYFLEVAREHSLVKASKSLGVNHTTVSRRIQALEEELGARLFDRSRNRYTMTQIGENLLEQTRELEEKVFQIERTAIGGDAALAGQLKLTITHELANRIIVPEIGGFCLKYPAIDLELILTKTMADLASMEADIAIRLTDSPPEYLVGRELMKISHGIYGTNSMVNSMEGAIDVVLFRDEVRAPAWVTDNFKDFRVVLRVDDVGTMAAAVKSGLGIAKMPCFIGDTEPALRRLDLDIGSSNWGVWMLNHVDLRATARVRACKDYLEALFESKKSLIQGEKSRYLG